MHFFKFNKHTLIFLRGLWRLRALPLAGPTDLFSYLFSLMYETRVVRIHDHMSIVQHLHLQIVVCLVLKFPSHNHHNVIFTCFIDGNSSDSFISIDSAAITA